MDDTPPFATDDPVEYVTGSDRIVVAECYRAECVGRIRWIVQDTLGNRHFADKLRRIENLPHWMEPRWLQAI